MTPSERRTRRSAVARATVATVVAGGLAAGGYGIAAVASGSGAAAAQPGTQALTAASKGSTSAKPASGHWRPRGPGGGGMFGGPGPGTFGGGSTVTAVTATSITVKSLFGRSLTVTTNASTTYSENGKKVARSAITVGEQVTFRMSQPSKSSSSASAPLVTAIALVQPHVYGKVVSVNGSQIVVSEANGSTEGLNVTVNTSPSATSYDEVGHSVSAAEVKVGTVVLVTGTLSSDHDQIDATSVEIVPASVSGEVTGIAGTTITIKSFDGTLETVTTTSSTVFRGASAKASLASVVKGDQLEVFGTPAAGGRFAALTVFVGPSFPNGKGRSGGFGGGFGHGFGGGFRGGPGGGAPNGPPPATAPGSATL